MAGETRAYPFTAFNFEVRIRREGQAALLCGGAFAECDGLDMSMEVKTIRQGGDNRRQIRLAGPAAFGQLTLKRGMTKNFDLWKWFSDTLDDPGLRADAEVVVFAADGNTVQVRFALTRCLPVKLKTPALNAREGKVAVEELQLAYETASIKGASL
jgi:phage tail-like protein